MNMNTVRNKLLFYITDKIFVYSLLTFYFSMH